MYNHRQATTGDSLSQAPAAQPYSQEEVGLHLLSGEKEGLGTLGCLQQQLIEAEDPDQGRD